MSYRNFMTFLPFIMLLGLGCNPDRMPSQWKTFQVDIPGTNFKARFPTNFQERKTVEGSDLLKGVTKNLALSKYGYLVAEIYEFSYDVSDRPEELDKLFDKYVENQRSNFKGPNKILGRTQFRVHDSGGGYDELARYIYGEGTAKHPLDMVWGFAGMVDGNKVVMLYSVLSKANVGEGQMRDMFTGTYYLGPEYNNIYKRSNDATEKISLNNGKSILYYDPKIWKLSKWWGNKEKSGTMFMDMKNNEVSAQMEFRHIDIRFTQIENFERQQDFKLSHDSVVVPFDIRCINGPKYKLFQADMTVNGKPMRFLIADHSNQWNFSSIRTYCERSHFEKNKIAMLELINGFVLFPEMEGKDFLIVNN